MGAHELGRVHSARSYGVWESGVDTTVFEPERWESRGTELRHSLGLEDSFVVFYHGTIAATRGLDRAIRAFAQLKQAGRAPGSIFVILGDGGARQVMEQLAQDLDAPVRFLGRVPYSDVPGYIAMSDVGLIPLPDFADWRYQHPLKFTEYLSMQLPVIVPTSPAFTTVAGDSEAVEYLAEVAPEAIADAVAKCFDDRDHLQERSKDSRHLADKYTWERIVGRLVGYAKTIGVA
jgi:glycosyltransferase involved in cell wall biosynthesis